MMMLKLPKVNILVAFPYFSKAIIKLLDNTDPNIFRLIIDSGAFTAWNTNKPIIFNDYCKFLKNIPKNWEYKAVQLDVFGNPEGTFINYNKMLDLGFKDIMPVFTRGDTTQRLEQYYENTDYIMFGGIVIGGKNKNYIKWFHNVNKKRKSHWLGFNNTEFIKYYKPESVDSSTWNNGQRFGRLDLYKGNGEFVNTVRTDYINMPNSKIINLIKKLGFDSNIILKLSKKESWSGGSNNFFEKKDNYKGLASYINNTSHLKRALDIEKNLGTKVYLACGNNLQVKIYSYVIKILTNTQTI
tara:strand:+ start:611 stop:1504 length:894 start_codon:yes stop_codon:yes gene_type:complete